jgi:hypothetical protein
MPLYDAFISYSHTKDKPIAAALQSVVQKLGKPWYKQRALRVFCRHTSLSATPQAWPTIVQALGQSRFLILLASPEAAASPEVNKEIAYWLETKSADTLLIGVTDGAFAWDDAANDFAWSETTPLPLALKRKFSAEPEWVDLSAYHEDADKGDARFIELAAGFAAADPGNALWQRDLGVSLDRVGDVRLAAGDRAGALAAYEEDLAIARKLAAADPGNAQWQADLVLSLYKLSTVSDPPQARAALREALAIAEALARDGKPNVAQQDWLQRLRDALAKLPPEAAEAR